MYAYGYPSNLVQTQEDEEPWERHLNVMIVADKYGLPKLEKMAFVHLKSCLRAQAQGPALLQAIKRSREYSDHLRFLKELLVQLCQSRFVELFEDSDFRAWYDALDTSSQDHLVLINFVQLVGVAEFRARLEADGGAALRHIDRLVESSGKSGSCKHCRRHDRYAWQ